MHAVLLQPQLQDVPVCLPQRTCVDQTPLTAPLITLTSTLTPFTPLIAAGCFAAAGLAVVLIGLGLRKQWRTRVIPRRLGALIAGLLLVGLGLSWVVSSRLAVIDLIYSDVFGQAAAPVPPTLIGSWPTVLVSGWALSVVGASGLVATVSTALLNPGRGTGEA